MTDLNPTSLSPTTDEKNLSVIMHLSLVLGYWSLVGLLIPLMIWLLKRDQSAFIDRQGKEVINFAISYAIYALCISPLCLILIGIPMLMGLALIASILSVVAAIKVSEGVAYRYPFTIRLIK